VKGRIADRGLIAGQRDQRGGVGGLGAEGQVEEDERVRIEVEDQVDVAGDPGDRRPERRMIGRWAR
jgi:hypothetical protein